MTDDPKVSTETLAESTYDTQSGRMRQGSDGKLDGWATSPRATVEDAPEDPGRRAGTEAEEPAHGQGRAAFIRK